MKFTKKEAYELLVADLTKTGKTLALSDRTINEQLDSLITLVVTDETELVDFLSKVKPMVKSMNANLEKTNADFVKKYQEENPVVKPTEPVVPPVIPATDAATQALQARLDALEAKEKAAEKAKTLSGVRNTLLAKMKEKGIMDEDWAKEYISEVNITEDFDVDGGADRYLTVFNKLKANFDPNTTPLGATGGGKPQSKFEDVITKRNRKYKEENNLK